MPAIGKIVENLCRLSSEVRSHSPGFNTSSQWPRRIDKDGLCFSSELLSLDGTDYFNKLGAAARRKLSFYETINFFSLNIHGETALIREVSERLDRCDSEIKPYLIHFIDEECEHTSYFQKFCHTYAGNIYGNRTIPFQLQNFSTAHEDFLCFAKILIFEDIVDGYNHFMACDPSLVPIVRRINSLHHRDEVRHLAFGRQFASRLFKKLRASATSSELSAVRAYLKDYMRMTWRTYHNHYAYQDADASLTLDQAIDLSEISFNSTQSQARRQRICRRLNRFFSSSGIFEEALES